MFVILPSVMTIKSRCAMHRPSYLLSARSVYYYCVILLLGFTLWGGRSVALGSTSGATLSLQPSYTISASSDLTGSAAYVSLPPVISRIVYGQLEVFDEIGPNDDAPEAGLGKAIDETGINKHFDFAAAKNPFTSYAEVNQSCASICLFILHHSWRSFLS